MLKKIKRLFCKHKNAVEVGRLVRDMGNGEQKLKCISYQCPNCGEIFTKQF